VKVCPEKTKKQEKPVVSRKEDSNSHFVKTRCCAGNIVKLWGEIENRLSANQKDILSHPPDTEPCGQLLRRRGPLLSQHLKLGVLLRRAPSSALAHHIRE